MVVDEDQAAKERNGFLKRIDPEVQVPLITTSNVYKSETGPRLLSKRKADTALYYRNYTKVLPDRKAIDEYTSASLVEQYPEFDALLKLDTMFTKLKSYNRRVREDKLTRLETIRPDLTHFVDASVAEQRLVNLRKFAYHDKFKIRILIDKQANWITDSKLLLTGMTILAIEENILKNEPEGEDRDKLIKNISDTFEDLDIKNYQYYARFPDTDKYEIKTISAMLKNEYEICTKTGTFKIEKIIPFSYNNLEEKILYGKQVDDTTNEIYSVYNANKNPTLKVGAQFEFKDTGLKQVSLAKDFKSGLMYIFSDIQFTSINAREYRSKRKAPVIYAKGKASQNMISIAETKSTPLSSNLIIEYELPIKAYFSGNLPNYIKKWAFTLDNIRELPYVEGLLRNKKFQFEREIQLYFLAPTITLLVRIRNKVKAFLKTVANTQYKLMTTKKALELTLRATDVTQWVQIIVDKIIPSSHISYLIEVFTEAGAEIELKFLTTNFLVLWGYLNTFSECVMDYSQISILWTYFIKLNEELCGIAITFESNTDSIANMESVVTAYSKLPPVIGALGESAPSAKFTQSKKIKILAEVNDLIDQTSAKYRKQENKLQEKQQALRSILLNNLGLKNDDEIKIKENEWDVIRLKNDLVSYIRDRNTIDEIVIGTSLEDLAGIISSFIDPVSVLFVRICKEGEIVVPDERKRLRLNKAFKQQKKLSEKAQQEVINKYRKSNKKSESILSRSTMHSILDDFE
ncbi:MAG: hypothetical protein ACRYGG_11435 [Janthinobacterium lividum]